MSSKMGGPIASEMRVERIKSFFPFAAILFVFVLFYNIILIQSMDSRKHIYLSIGEYLYVIKTLQQYIHYKQLCLQ